MGRIFKRGRVWYVDVRFKGRRIRKAAGHSKKIAELALKDAEVSIAKDKFGFAKNDLSLEKFLQQFLEYSRTQHRTASTARYKAVVDHFKAFLHEHSHISLLSEIGPELIDRYKMHRKGSSVNGNGQSAEDQSKHTNTTRQSARAHTINFELDTLRLIFNMAIQWGHLLNNPTKGIKRLKIDDAKPPRFLTEEECRLLLGASPKEERDIFFTFLHTGMRKAELENLQWQDVDFGRKQIMIRRKDDWQPKSGERDIPISQPLLELLLKVRDKLMKSKKNDYVFEVKKQGRSRNWMRTQLIKIASEGQIEGLTKLHTLRHTFASHLVMQGVDLPTVSKLLGHSDIETTMIYAHLAPEHLANAVDKLRF